MFTKNTCHVISIMIIAAAVTFASCRKNDFKSVQTAKSEASLESMISENGANPDELMLQDNKTTGYSGYVYTESNDAAQNSILIYKQNADGTLSWYKTVASGGKGTGVGLGSQGAVVLDEYHHWLYAVNAGDNSVSSFQVNSDGSLTLAHTAECGGVTPISVTVHGNYLYVVNVGSSTICGFEIGVGGTLTKIHGSVQNLSANPAAPPQILFHPKGKVVYVTEKMTNKIAVFKLNDQGAANKGTFIESDGVTPFGFEFARNEDFMIVSNAAGGAADAGSATSYSTDKWGNTKSINGAVPNFQAAPCWVATTRAGRFAFVTNTASNTISSYYISPVGSLHLIFFTIAKTDKAPVDIVVSAGNRYVYEINSVSHTIGEYKRGLLGTLNKIGTVTNLPPAAVGLACY